MKAASSTILLLVCMSIVAICCNGQPLRFGGRQQQRATAAATARTLTSNPSSSYTSPYASSYPYAAATSLPTASLTPQQIATMMAQAQQLPITTSSIGSNSNMMYNGINMPTNINMMRQPSSMSQPAVTQPILQQPLQQQQQQPLSSMYGGQPNARYQYPQQLSSMMSQPITGQTIATPAATSSLPVPTNMATSMNVNTMPSSSPSVMTSGIDTTAAAAATSGTPTAMTLDQLFQMYPDMRAQYAGMTPSLPTSYQGVPIAPMSSLSSMPVPSSASSSFASAPIMSSQQQPNAMMTDFSNAQPYTSYAPYAAINAAGIPMTSPSGSPLPSASAVPLSSSPSFPSPIIANPSEPMAYIQSLQGGNAYAGVDNTAAMADNEYTTQGVTAESVNDANSNGCPSMADNPELVSQGGNSYAVTFTPTQAGIPITDVTNVMIDGDISGRRLSSAMQSNGIGGWQTLVDIQPGDTINWSYIFNSGTTSTNSGANNGAPLTCQGQSYSAQIPMTATASSTQPSTDASAPLVNGPGRTLLGVQQPQQQQQPQYQQYQQMYQPQPIYAQQPQQYQQQYQQQMYQQQMLQQQQQQPAAGSVSDAAIRRPCPANAVHQAIIAPLPVKTGRPIDAGATMYGVSFIANNDISPLDYVDLHYSINSGTPWQQNIRMVRNATNPNRFDYTFGLPLKQNDELGIQFTYSSQYNDCDTPEQSFNPTSGLANNNNNNNDMNGVDSSSATRPMMTTTTGAPTSIAASCPTISYTSDVPLLGIDDNGMDMFGLNFIGQMGAPVDWVETHYRVNNQPQQNYRMISSTPGMFELQGISMNRGDQLSYSFTHSINGIDCDTPAKTFINQGSDTITNYGINTNRNANSNGVNGVGVSPIGTPAPVVNTACGRTRYVSSVTGTPINRKNIKPGSENLYDLSFRVTDGAPLEYVDAHYTITRSPSAIQPWQTNDRMDMISGTNYGASANAANGMMDTSSSTFVTPGITLLPGDILGYSFTFQPYHGDACDTATETFTVV